MTTNHSPLAPNRFPHMPPIAGVRLATANCGIRYQKRDELMVAVLDQGTAAAGVLTRSLTASAPVLWCREALKGGRARVVVANSGNSNAFTGRAGQQTLDATVDSAILLTGCESHEVFVASTGVIGQPFPSGLIPAQMSNIASGLTAESSGWTRAAAAIMTTDTFPKGATRTAKIGDVTVTINGFAKGSGMIAPDMATMLAFLFTDAAIPAPVLQSLLTDAVDRSFNAITVDGDTSTSDTMLLFATGRANNALPKSADSIELAGFRRALNEVALDLAHQVVRDGEGATKFVKISVTGAKTDSAAKRIALTVANSPLVKTAIAGEDANWGRIVAAVGRSGEQADRDLLRISIGGILIASEGMAVPGYDETPVTRHMKSGNIDVLIEIGLGQGNATVWTCDLTHGYIDINGSYRS
ncbi:Glutamate N-acetyltransferase / Amino-acid acetyltransferase [Azospirillaceae bacterium]